MCFILPNPNIMSQQTNKYNTAHFVKKINGELDKNEEMQTLMTDVPHE